MPEIKWSVAKEWTVPVLKAGLSKLDSLHTQIPVLIDKLPINNEISSFIIVLVLCNALIYFSSLSVTRKSISNTTGNTSKIIMNTSDILQHLMNYRSLGIWSTLLIPVMASISLLSLYYLIDFNDVLKYFNDFILLTSLFKNFSSFYFFLQAFVPQLNLDRYFQFSFTINQDYKGPVGYLESIDFEELSELPINPSQPFSNDKKEKDKDESGSLDSLNFKYYLLANRFKIIHPKPIVPNHSLMINVNFLIAMTLAGVLSASTYYYQSSYILANLTAINFTIFALIDTNLIKKISHGSLLLVLLFFYDIYFVFGSKVMVTVAQNIDLPIKLLIPKLITDSSGLSTIGFSLLGLGDIVLPGSFILLVARYNPNWLFLELVLYSFGLIESFLAVFMFNSGQPALLYIVPNLLLGTFGFAWLKNELSPFWKYSIEIDPYDDDTDYKQQLKSARLDLAALDSDIGGSELDELDDDYQLDSYDEWEFKVEDLRDQYDEEQMTDKDIDIDDDRVDSDITTKSPKQTIYNFIDDDDDQTFIIEHGDSENDDNEGDVEDDESDSEDVADDTDDDEDDEDDDDDDDISILIKDSETTPSYWYD